MLVFKCSPGSKGNNGVSGDVNGEHAGQLQDALLDPIAAMLKTLAGDLIDTAQKSPAHAAENNVIPGGLFKGYLGVMGKSDVNQGSIRQYFLSVHTCYQVQGPSLPAMLLRHRQESLEQIHQGHASR